MSKRWSPDSCPCVLIVDDNISTFESWERRCNEHKALDGQALLDAVLIHNQTLNKQFSVPRTPTDEDIKNETIRIMSVKKAERDRIEAEGTTERSVS